MEYRQENNFRAVFEALESVDGYTDECAAHGEHDPGCWTSRYGEPAQSALREIGAEMESMDRELTALQNEHTRVLVMLNKSLTAIRRLSCALRLMKRGSAKQRG